MRHLSTAALIGVASASIGLSAPAKMPDLHPVLGKKPPLEVLNSDILALPDRERQAFIHGAMVQMVSGLAATNPEAGKCVTEWYFEIGDGAETMPVWLKRYPDMSPAVTFIAVAKQYCPQLRVEES